MVLNTYPPAPSMASVISASCLASAEAISVGWSSQALVLPSMSVNSNVTFPDGADPTARG